MSLIFGPFNPEHIFGGPDLSPQPNNPVVSSAKNLADAIADYEKAFDVKIMPYVGDLIERDEAKFFTIILNTGEDSGLVDIHVTRNGEEICLKQDVQFELIESDVVSMGRLGC
jgi:hypothetical protein